MAYKKDNLFKKTKEVIKKYQLTFIEDLIQLLPCCKQTFYTMFPVHSPEYEEINEKLEYNKTVAKMGLRQKWYKGDNPTSQIALYKLLGTKDEREILSTNRVEQAIDPVTIIIQDDYGESSDE